MKHDIEYLVRANQRELKRLEDSYQQLSKAMGSAILDGKIEVLKETIEHLTTIAKSKPLFPMRDQARDIEKSDAVDAALKFAMKYSQMTSDYDSDHGASHKSWVIDQMVRILAGKNYDKIVKAACAGEGGANTYTWDVGVGIPP